MARPGTGPVTSSPVGPTMRWAAAAGTRYWTPHWAARRTSTGRRRVRPCTVQLRMPSLAQEPRAGSAMGGSVGSAMECSTSQAAVPLPVAYWMLKVVLSPIFFLLWRVRIEGREHVPATGPAVLAAHHQSVSDSFFLPLVLRRRVTY